EPAADHPAVLAGRRAGRRRDARVARTGSLHADSVRPVHRRRRLAVAGVRRSPRRRLRAAVPARRMSGARPFTVALTGGVASGKTEVERRFAALGAHVIDADVVARELVEPGGPALDAIVHAFGAEVLDRAGGLDRAAMRKRVFADADARTRLEAILHPRIREILRQRSDAILDGYALLVIPLLVESGEYTWV